MRRREETLIPTVCPAFRRQPISGHPDKSPGAARSSNSPPFQLLMSDPWWRLPSSVRSKKWKSVSKYSLFLHKIRYFPYSTFSAFIIEWQHIRGM